MGKLRKLRRQKKITSPVKVIDPKPVWVAEIETESGKIVKRYMNFDEAEKYMKAGHPVKMITTVGELQQYD